MSKRLYLSQSFIKAMNKGNDLDQLGPMDKPKCPRKAKAIYIQGLPSRPSEAMTKGNYFETLIWGSTDSGEVVQMDLKRNGTKSIDQKRIETNAWHWKNTWTGRYRMDSHELRPHVMVGLGERYVFRARMDLWTSLYDPVVRNELIPRVIMDVKLTADINTMFGPFPWGNPPAMDHTQAYSYIWAYEKVYQERLPFVYFVVPYKKTGDHKLVHIITDSMRQLEFTESLRRTIDLVEEYDRKNHWPLFPSEENCKGCPLREHCVAYRTGGSSVIVDY